MPVNIGATHPFQDQTVRMVMRLSFGGSRVRIRLSNADGTHPIVLADAHVGIAGSGAAIRGPAVALTFRGSSAITIPVGQSVLSDPAVLHVQALQRLVVSVYAPSDTGPGTGDRDELAQYFVASGNQAAALSGQAFGSQASRSGYFVTGIDVYAPNDGLIVAFGDSITAGFRTAGEGWPYWLANRLAALAARGGPRYSVIDMGISGNDLTHTHGGRPQTISGQARLARDALDQTGFRMLLMMEGINDIGGAGGRSPVPAPQLEAAYKNIIRQVQLAHGQLLLSPLTPAGDVLAPNPYGTGYWDSSGIADRLAVSRWIRNQSGVFSPGFDFPPVVSDPHSPNHLTPQFDSGDHLHPNVAGQQAMADSINLATMTRRLNPHSETTASAAISFCFATFATAVVPARVCLSNSTSSFTRRRTAASTVWRCPARPASASTPLTTRWMTPPRSSGFTTAVVISCVRSW